MHRRMRFESWLRYLTEVGVEPLLGQGPFAGLSWPRRGSYCLIKGFNLMYDSESKGRGRPATQFRI